MCVHFEVTSTLMSTHENEMSLFISSTSVRGMNNSFFLFGLSPVNLVLAPRAALRFYVCGFSKFPHVRTILRTIFFVASH